MNRNAKSANLHSSGRAFMAMSVATMALCGCRFTFSRNAPIDPDSHAASVTITHEGETTTQYRVVIPSTIPESKRQEARSIANVGRKNRMPGMTEEMEAKKGEFDTLNELCDHSSPYWDPSLRIQPVSDQIGLPDHKKTVLTFKIPNVPYGTSIALFAFNQDPAFAAASAATKETERGNLIKFAADLGDYAASATAAVAANADKLSLALDTSSQLRTVTRSLPDATNLDTAVMELDAVVAKLEKVVTNEKVTTTSPQNDLPALKAKLSALKPATDQPGKEPQFQHGTYSIYEAREDKVIPFGVRYGFVYVPGTQAVVQSAYLSLYPFRMYSIQNDFEGTSIAAAVDFISFDIGYVPTTKDVFTQKIAGEWKDRHPILLGLGFQFGQTALPYINFQAGIAFYPNNPDDHYKARGYAGLTLDALVLSQMLAKALVK